MPLLPNVFIAVARSTVTAGVTGAATSVSSGIDGHIMPTSQTNYKVLPTAALESDYIATVDSGTDIIEGDILTITLRDGVTPWPGINATNANETWRVVYTQESTAGPLAHRKVYVVRSRGGGPVY